MSSISIGTLSSNTSASSFKPLNVCYYLAAIGEKNYNEKVNILVNNLKIINSNLEKVGQYNLDLVYNLYSSSQEYLESHVKDHVNNIFSQVKEGVLAELWLSNKKDFSSYDHIIFILDDVIILEGFDLVSLIKNQKDNGVDIISPSVFNSSHKYMNEHPNNKTFSFTGEIELYFYLMNHYFFLRYLSTVIIENPWTWGNNKILRSLGFKMGIDYNNKTRHMYRYKSSTIPHKKGLLKLMKHFGYKNQFDYCKKHPNFIYYI